MSRLATSYPILYKTHPSIFHCLASNALRADSNVIVPESVGSTTVRLPTKVNTLDLRLRLAVLPAVGVRSRVVGLVDKALDRDAVEPGGDGTIGGEMVLEALPGVGGDALGGCDAVGGEIGEGGVVGLVVVHEDLALAANAKVLALSLSGVGHGDESDVRVIESLLRFPIKLLTPPPAKTKHKFVLLTSKRGRRHHPRE